MSPFEPRRLRSLLLLPALVASGPLSAATIDTFATNQGPLVDPPGGASSVATGGADIVGLRRDLTVRLLSGLPGGGGMGPVSAGVAGGVLIVNVPDTTPNSRGEAVVTWDGDSDPNVLDPDGLAPLDLGAGNHSAFRFVVDSAGAGTELVLEVYTDAANSSLASVRLPAIAAPTPVFLSWGAGGDFVPRLGSGADFADVGAIVLTVRGTETSASIDLIDTAAPSVAATKVDLTVAGAPIGATPQVPGATFKYRVEITNTGGTAQTVDLADTIDANLTLSASTVDATPIARNDAYATSGNVGKSVLAAAGLLANDSDPDQNGSPPELVVTTTGAIATVLGGTATVAADGSFAYAPPVGVGNAVDSFGYTVQDNETPANTAMATAKIAIGPRIWFVDNAACGPPPCGSGTFAAPFGGLASAQTASSPGDTIFVFTGSGSYPGGITLKDRQTLHGQGVALVVDGVELVAAGARPVIANAAGAGVTVAVDDTLRGFDVGNTTTYDIAGSNFGTLTVASVALSGQGGALDLDNGTLAATFGAVVVTSGVNGVDLDAVTGTLAIAGTTISGITGTGIRVTNGGSTYTFGATSINAPVGLNLTTNATSTFGFSSLAVTATAGAGLLANASGTLNIGGTGNTLSATGGPAVDLTSTSLGSGATFSSVSSATSTGKGINLDTVTGTLAMNGGSITGSANIAFDVNAGTGAISYTGSITNAANRAVEVTGRTTSTVSLSGAISDAGSGVNIASNSGGTVTLAGTYSGTTASSQIDIASNSGTAVINFSGATKTLSTGSSNAIDITNNGTAQVHFTGGGLAITTTSGTGFNATGGAGGITVQGSNNILASTTGTALNVANTQIGAAHLTFRSITAGTGAGSAGVGISVVGSGVAAGNGGLHVTGSGTAASGGTIQHKTGADASTSAGIGIYLQDTKGVQLARMQLNDFDNAAISGRNVHGFTLEDSVINGTNGTNSAAAGDGAIYFGLSNPSGTNGLQGTGLIRNTRVRGAIEHNVEFYNQSGSMNLTIEGTTAISEGANLGDPSDDVADCIIEENSTGSGADGIQIEMQGTANATIVIDRCLFRDNKSQAVQVNSTTDSMVTLTVDESYTRKFDQGNEGFLAQNAGNSDMVVRFSNNHCNNYGGVCFFVGPTAGNASASSSLHASIVGNVVNQPSTATNHGIVAFLTANQTDQPSGVQRILIDSNTVDNGSLSGTTRGILVDTPDTGTAPVYHATVTNNTVLVEDSVAGVSGLVVQSRKESDACANIRGNTVRFPNGNPGVQGIRARQADTATFDLESSASCSGTAASVLACLNPGNPPPPATTTEVLGTLVVVPQGTCLLPLSP